MHSSCVWPRLNFRLLSARSFDAVLLSPRDTFGSLHLLAHPPFAATQHRLALLPRSLQHPPSALPRCPAKPISVLRASRAPAWAAGGVLALCSERGAVPRALQVAQVLEVAHRHWVRRVQSWEVVMRRSTREVEVRVLKGLGMSLGWQKRSISVSSSRSDRSDANCGHVWMNLRMG